MCVCVCVCVSVCYAFTIANRSLIISEFVDFICVLIGCLRNIVNGSCLPICKTKYVKFTPLSLPLLKQNIFWLLVI